MGRADESGGAATVVIGVGIDEVEVDRIARALSRRDTGDRFRRRVFTEREAAWCEGRRRSAENFAARFAAKEATAKALGTGIGRGVRWRDIEVVREAGSAPQVRLWGGAARRAQELGVRRLHVSLTHTSARAMAVVIAEGEATEGAA